MMIEIKPLVLDCLFHTDESEALERIDVDYKLTDCDIKPIRFYQICALGPYEEDGKQYTKVFIPGDTFIANYPVEVVERMIQVQTITN